METTVKEAAEQGQYLTFQLGQEEYGIGLLQVKEIIEYETLTVVPSLPESIRGVINLRGSVVPVMDLEVKFGMTPSPVTKRTCIIIVDVAAEGKQTVMAVMANAVNEVVDLPASEVKPPPSFGTRVHRECIKGLGASGSKFILLLDIDQIFSPEEVISIASSVEEMKGEEQGDKGVGG